MGREVRRVPADWQHPKKADGSYKPLYGFAYAKCAADWDDGAELWKQGKRRDWTDETKTVDLEGVQSETYEEYAGERPVESDYMPDWPESERTHLQMYEDTTEGTPISPVMETAEELARWLADNNASAFGGMTATYQQWLATINRGHAFSMMVSSAGVESGVAAMGRMDSKES